LLHYRLTHLPVFDDFLDKASAPTPSPSLGGSVLKVIDKVDSMSTSSLGVMATMEAVLARDDCVILGSDWWHGM
jgi:hypothetical protein